MAVEWAGGKPQVVRMDHGGHISGPGYDVPATADRPAGSRGTWKLWDPADTSAVLIEGSEHLVRRVAGLIAGEGQEVVVERPDGEEWRVTPER